ncbi:MAG: hypothetical protein HWN66_19365 [Candidatus Helarchaeota archaeon]|nr:hypothetical protein [Candidatus Helarchaeota archaeon]
MQLYDLYVIYRGGQTIFHKRFGAMEIDQDLITAFLTAIENFSKEVLATDEPLRVIEKGFSKVLLAYGKDICCALVCGTREIDEVETLRGILELTLGDIQSQFAQILAVWKGDLRQLAGISDIVESNLKGIIRASAPPPLMELIQNPKRYYFTIDDRGINLYNTLLRESNGFRAFIEKLGIQIEWVDMILNEIRLGRKGALQLSQELGLEMNRLMALLRSLKLRGITLIWM